MIHHFKGPTKDIDFNDLIDAETLFDDIKSKKKRFEYVEKNERKFESKLSSVRIEGNKSSKQLSEKENITKFYKSREEAIIFIMIILKWYIKLHMIQSMEKYSKY